MLALVATADRPHITLAEVPDPQPLPNKALIDVKAFSTATSRARPSSSWTEHTPRGLRGSRPCASARSPSPPC
jgi:hypothetical protein